MKVTRQPGRDPARSRQARKKQAFDTSVRTDLKVCSAKSRTSLKNKNQSTALSAARNPSPTSGLCENGSVGFRPNITSSNRVCTLPNALGWL